MLVVFGVSECAVTIMGASVPMLRVLIINVSNGTTTAPAGIELQRSDDQVRLTAQRRPSLPDPESLEPDDEDEKTKQ
jgi:hypothetical protein